MWPIWGGKYAKWAKNLKIIKLNGGGMYYV